MGKPGFPMPQPRLGAAGAPPAGVRFDRLTAGGETRFPHLSTAGASGWRPSRQGCGSTGSPQVGKPGFPISQPLVRAAGDPTGRGAVRQAHRRWGNPVSPSLNRWWERLATQPAGGMGKPGFPMSQPRLGAAGDPASRGMGKPGFPICSHQAPCAGRTTPACNCGRATPSLALPRWGREPGSSPQGGARGNPVSPPIFKLE